MANRSSALAFVALSMSLFACADRSITRAKESVLRNVLFTIRTVIDEYRYDKQKAPLSLQDLVSEGYIKRIPEDPMTGSANSWRVVREDPKNAKDPKEPGILEMHSGSNKIALNGSRYSDW